MRLIATLDLTIRGGRKVLRIMAGNLVDHANSVDLVVIPAGGRVAEAFVGRGIPIPPFEYALSNERLEHRSSATLAGLRYRTWVIRPPNDDQRFRLLIFSPNYFESISNAYRYLFESLVHFLSSDDVQGLRRVRTMALPILFAGSGGVAVEVAAPPLMRGLIHWLALGLPIDGVDFVVQDGQGALKAADLLRHEVAAYLESPIGARPPIRHDVFLSYSRHDTAEADWVARTLQAVSPGLRLFRDVISLRIGGIWQHELFVALDASKRVLALLSPHYLSSQFCVEEYNIVVTRDRQDGSSTLFPVLLESTTLPGYMQLRQYVDCRPRDRTKLGEMCQVLVDTLGESRR